MLKLLKSTELGRSYSPPKLAHFFEPQCIDLNTELRTKAKNNFEKDFFKLMNNSVFGKTIENIENRVDIKLVTDKEKARKLAAKPNYDHCTIFDENLIAIHMTKTKIYYNIYNFIRQMAAIWKQRTT